MYEHRSQPLIPRASFIRRILWHGLIAAALILASLALGVFGYRFFGGLSWIDSLLNASMILGGMGQVSELTSAGGKLFASFYSLFAGIAFLATAAVLIAPIAHRLLQNLHFEDKEK